MTPGTAGAANQARALLAALSIDVATSGEARQMLALKGGDRVGF